MSGRAALVSNFAILGFLGFFAWLQRFEPLAYYASAQEDRALEWASFWSFLLAGAVFAVAAHRHRRARGGFPWFLLGVGAFCFVVAMEEISWGQRVLGYQPPEYFLAANYQQEINIHNIADQGLRMWAFRAIILGYGVLLPLLSLSAPVRRLLDRAGIVSPAIELTPSMFAIFWLHLNYPWKFTGEITECALGFGFLFIAMANASDGGDARQASLFRAAFLPALVALLGFSTAAWSQNRQAGDPSLVDHARAETKALAADLARQTEDGEPDSITRCGLHKRLFTFVQTRESARHLGQGSFAALVGEGLPPDRAEYFLDPWSSPYWVRDRCDRRESRRVVFVYSFGPNRARDSSRWKILGDDIGYYVVERPAR